MGDNDKILLSQNEAESSGNQRRTGQGSRKGRREVFLESLATIQATLEQGWDHGQKDGDMWNLMELQPLMGYEEVRVRVKSQVTRKLSV